MYNKENYLKLLIIIALLAFVIQISLIGIEGITMLIVLSKASFSITVTLLFHLGFSKWFWKLKYLQPMIVRVPNLHGTWKGSLISNWVDPQTQKIPPEISLIVYIRQSFDSISIEVHTEKMVSTSFLAGFVTNPETGVQDLCYSYTSKSKVESRETNPWHEGTAELSIFDGSLIRLEGEYWTSRKTIGSIKLSRTSEKIERI